jgi:voltage-gated potassium channel Kch
MVVLAASTAFVLGAVGFSEHSASADESRTLLDIVYLTIQLFVLQSGAVTPPLPWQLDIARFLAPAIAGYTAARALAQALRRQLQSLHAGFFKNHVVIAGLGKRGMLLAEAFYRRGERVIVIESDQANDFIPLCVALGIPVLEGDARQAGTLLLAGIRRAARLFAVGSNDGINAEIAVQARTLCAQRTGTPLTCHLHLVDPALCELLQERELSIVASDRGARFEFFNIFETGAREILKEYPAFEPKSQLRQHLVVVGVGHFGESLIVHAAKAWWKTRSLRGGRLRVTLLDRNATQRKKMLSVRYPRLEQACELIPIDMDIDSPEFLQGVFLEDNSDRHGVTSMYVCLDDDAVALSAGLMLHDVVKGLDIPVVVRQAGEGGLGSFIQERAPDASRGEGLESFPLLEKTCQPDLLLGGTCEVLARAIHEEYTSVQVEGGKAADPARVRWEKLPEALKESNRRQADSIGAKLGRFRCIIEPLRDWDAPAFEFSSEEVEVLARLEHARWLSERRRGGWRFDPLRKDLDKKATPALVPWEQLTEDAKHISRESVRNLPHLLADIGFRIRRLEAERSPKGR